MPDMDVAPVVEARGISATEAKKLIRKAFALERSAKAAVAGVNEAYWTLAESLYEFTEIRGWELLGYQFVDEFLAQPELGLKRSTYYHATRMWRDLVVVKGVSPARLAELSPAKVQEVVPTIMAGNVDVDQALGDAAALGKSDLREHYAGGGGPGTDVTVKATCPTCGSRVRADLIEERAS